MEARVEQKIFIKEDLENLLFEVLKKKEEEYIFFDSYPRYGNSGSKLYLIYFSKGVAGLPYILKTFENETKFKNEKEGMKKIKSVYTYANNFIACESKLSGILLECFNVDDKINTPNTLANIINNKDVKENEICEIIKKAFKQFYLIKRPVKTNYIKIKDTYAWYVKERGEKTKEIIKNLTDDNIKGKEIKFYGQKITNPVYIIENMIERTEITSTLIHGDLHQNNIVLTDFKDPRIIDFEWSCDNDIYIDFSLLEISIRYWNPPLLRENLQNELEEIFLSDDVETHIDKYEEDKKARKMMIIVNEIRRQCKEYIKEHVNGRYDFNHHLLSQFLILYGLAHKNEYNPFLVIPFLAKLGKKLDQSGYVKKVQ